MTLWPELDTPATWKRQLVVTASRGIVSETLKVLDGTLTQDSRQPIRWTGELTVAAPTPIFPSDLLTPYGTLVGVQAGIIHPVTGAVVQTASWGVYQIERANAANVPGYAAVRLKLTDIAQRVAAYKFETPLLCPAGTDLATIADQVWISRLGTASGLAATGLLLPRDLPMGVTSTTDPWRELVDLFAANGLQLFHDGAGILRAQPPPVATTGTVIGGADFEVAFEQRPANVIVARGEQDEGVPVQAVVMDTDPLSPTYAGVSAGSSPYGRVTDYVDSPMIIDATLAAQAASARLAERVGAQVTITRPFDPGIQPGDTVVLATSSAPLRVLVDSVSLNVTADTVINGRAQ